jgi:uncharacterized protein
MRAAKELGATAPLLEVGLTKQDVRELSRAIGLPTWDQPSAACLASRVPYGQPLSAESLVRIGAAEAAVRELTGVADCRVRDHHPVARLELSPQNIGRAVEPGLRAALVERLQALGYQYVALDLAGLRSGSLNEVLAGDGETHG